MEWVCIALVCIACTWIITDDFRHRSIHILCLLLLCAGLAGWVLQQQAFAAIAQRTLLNVLFLAFELGIVWLYFSIRQRQAVSFFDKYLGWGDVLLLLCFALVFNLVWFVLFLLGTCIISILAFGVSRIFAPHTFTTIPLAAMLCLCFFPLFIYDIASATFSICNDDYIYYLISLYTR